MGKKGGDDGAAAANAAQARSDEQARQSRVRDGTARINSLFDGTPYTPAPATTGLFGTKVGATAASPDPLAGNTFGGFTDDFYNKIGKSYSDFATPQLEDQLADARKQLTFSLDRSHLLDSSARADQEGVLAKQAGTARQQIADTALSTQNQARTAVEGARADLINTLDATGNAEGAVSNALSRATALSQPTQFSPLAGLFSNFTSGLGTQAAAEKAQYYSNGLVKAPFNTGLFTPGSSMKVT